MEILVTGGAGFIGSNIVDKLIEEGHQVVIVDNLSSGKKEYINQKAEFYQLDIRDAELEKVFKNHEITHVIHHAAQIDVQLSIKDPLFDAENNILGTINLLEKCRKYEAEKIIYASSAAVYGEPGYLPIDEAHPVKPMSAYGVSKYTPEHYIKMYAELYDLKYTILRYANAYGPRQDPKGEGGVVSIFVNQMLKGEEPIIFGDGAQTRDFIHVYDLVKANLLALEKGDNELVNISTAERNSVNQLVNHLQQLMDSGLKAVYHPARDGDIKHSALANQKAKDVLGWDPYYSFNEGLKQTLEYYSEKCN
jgi:UDP-glucose 4-epimerase